MRNLLKYLTVLLLSFFITELKSTEPIPGIIFTPVSDWRKAKILWTGNNTGNIQDEVVIDCTMPGDGCYYPVSPTK